MGTTVFDDKVKFVPTELKVCTVLSVPEAAPFYFIIFKPSYTPRPSLKLKPDYGRALRIVIYLFISHIILAGYIISHI